MNKPLLEKDRVTLEEAVEHCVQEGDLGYIYDLVKQAKEQERKRLLQAILNEVKEAIEFNTAHGMTDYDGAFEDIITILKKYEEKRV